MFLILNISRMHSLKKKKKKGEEETEKLPTKPEHNETSLVTHQLKKADSGTQFWRTHLIGCFLCDSNLKCIKFYQSTNSVHDRCVSLFSNALLANCLICLFFLMVHFF